MEVLTVPAELITLIAVAVGGAVTWLVVEGFKGISEAFGKDLSKVAKVIAAIVSTGVVGIVVGVINVLASLVPAEFVPVVQTGLALLLSLFSAFGLARRAKLTQAH